MNHPMPCAVERDLAAHLKLMDDMDSLSRDIEDEARNLVGSGAFLAMKWLADSDVRHVDEAMDKLAHVFAARTEKEQIDRLRELKQFFMTSEVIENEALRVVKHRAATACEE